MAINECLFDFRRFPLNYPWEINVFIDLISPKLPDEQSEVVWRARGSQTPLGFLTRCSCLSCCPRFLPQPTEEPDAGEGGRRRAHRVPAQDVSVGRGLLAEGQRAARRKQQVRLHSDLTLWRGNACSHYSLPAADPWRTS